RVRRHCGAELRRLRCRGEMTCAIIADPSRQALPARVTNRRYQPASSMSRVLAIVNQKGGVGKTTTSVNLAASLAATKRKTLLVDLDPQGNATMGSGVDKRGVAASSYDILMGERELEESLLIDI